MFGFLNVNKPKGITSFDVVSRLRKVSGIKKIGHFGTLDPNAQGVMVVAISSASRLLEFLNDDKEYLATVQFGKSTTTFDVEGETTFISAKKITRNDILIELKIFEGEIEQTPPMYSAVHFDGKRLYEYARNNVQIKEIPKRKIVIYEIELMEFDEKNQEAKIRVHCSKGTYIRTIANDLGQRLGCGAYLSDLIRTKASGFDLINSIKLEDFKSKEDISENLCNPLEILPYRQKVLTELEYGRVLNGQFLKNIEYEKDQKIILVYNQKLTAIAQVIDSEIRVKKVFK